MLFVHIFVYIYIIIKNNIKHNKMKKVNNNTIDKIVFWSIIGIFVPMILGGIFTIIKNIDLVSFNF